MGGKGREVEKCEGREVEWGSVREGGGVEWRSVREGRGESLNFQAKLCS